MVDFIFNDVAAGRAARWDVVLVLVLDPFRIVHQQFQYSITRTRTTTRNNFQSAAISGGQYPPYDTEFLQR
jgi:hypothetical protein